MSESKEQQDDFDYFIVKRRKRKSGRSFRPSEERPMEPWERAVLNVFSNNEVRGQMLWEAGRIKLDHLKAVMVKADVSNIKDVMDELWLKLAHQSDEAQENRPYADIEAEREIKRAPLRKEIDQFYADSAAHMSALAEKES